MKNATTSQDQRLTTRRDQRSQSVHALNIVSALGLTGIMAYLFYQVSSIVSHVL